MNAVHVYIGTHGLCAQSVYHLAQWQEVSFYCLLLLSKYSHSKMEQTNNTASQCNLIWFNIKNLMKFDYCVMRVYSIGGGGVVLAITHQHCILNDKRFQQSFVILLYTIKKIFVLTLQTNYCYLPKSHVTVYRLKCIQYS